MPRHSDDWAQGYVPLLADVVNQDWSHVVGIQMHGVHYGLTLSPDEFNHATAMLIAAPITSKSKISGMELAINTDADNGVVVLSALRAPDYRNHSVK